MRRLLAVLVLAAICVIAGATAAAAVNYPPTTAGPTTTVQALGNNAHNDGTVAVAANSQGNGLPFTGGNSAAVAWVGVACVAAGGLVVTRARRRRTVRSS